MAVWSISLSTSWSSTAKTSRAFPLGERKKRLASLLKKPPTGIFYSEHQGGDGEEFRRAACEHRLEGIVSKRLDRGYLPDDRGAWVKTKRLNRAEFVIVGWSDPEGSRPLIGALLLGYYEPDGRLLYAGRVGTGMPIRTLQMLHQRRWRLTRCHFLSGRPATSASEGLWRCQRSIGFGQS
jgi:bifunctional non-homologous end joining protein LigD